MENNINNTNLKYFEDTFKLSNLNKLKKIETNNLEVNYLKLSNDIIKAKSTILIKHEFQTIPDTNPQATRIKQRTFFGQNGNPAYIEAFNYKSNKKTLSCEKSCSRLYGLNEDGTYNENKIIGFRYYENGYEDIKNNNYFTIYKVEQTNKNKILYCILENNSDYKNLYKSIVYEFNKLNNKIKLNYADVEQINKVNDKINVDKEIENTNNEYNNISLDEFSFLIFKLEKMTSNYNEEMQYFELICTDSYEIKNKDLVINKIDKIEKSIVFKVNNGSMLKKDIEEIKLNLSNNFIINDNSVNKLYNDVLKNGFNYNENIQKFSIKKFNTNEFIEIGINLTKVFSKILTNKNKIERMIQ